MHCRPGPCDHSLRSGHDNLSKGRVSAQRPKFQSMTLSFLSQENRCHREIMAHRHAHTKRRLHNLFYGARVLENTLIMYVVVVVLLSEKYCVAVW